MCGKNELQSGIWVIDLCTMAMHLLTLLSLCMNFWLHTTWVLFRLFMPCLWSCIFQVFS